MLSIAVSKLSRSRVARRRDTNVASAPWARRSARPRSLDRFLRTLDGSSNIVKSHLTLIRFCRMVPALAEAWNLCRRIGSKSARQTHCIGRYGRIHLGHWCDLVAPAESALS